MSNFHKPVLLTEVLEGLRVKQNEKYIDATLGGGGHSFEILRLGGIVLGIDVDEEALAYVSRRWKIESRNLNLKPESLTLARGNFRDLDKIALLNGFDKAAGIILDLGVSSHQIDTPTRGFSFQNEGPLDMRMDQDLGVRALDLIKILTKGELYEIFTKFGEEVHAFTISNAIVSARSVKTIETTVDLARLLRKKEMPKIFQALRIAINDELNALTEALPKALDLLRENGRLCVISFHSLEDRIVKRKFLEFAEKKMGKIITEKPIIPTKTEIENNKRSRSAKLRIFEKFEKRI